MPELLPVYEDLIAVLPEESMQRAVPMWNPPPLFAGCSVACVGDRSPTMLRNYDFDPARFEGRVWRSRLTGSAVLASLEGTWGALDGVNEHGLAVALTFGGGVEHGRGFAIPAIVRYLLETCATVGDARAALTRIPCAWVHNVVVLDRTGTQMVAYLRPGRLPEFENGGTVTNHQPGAGPSPVEDFESSQRRLDALLADVPAAEDFLAPPLYDPERTLYSVAYSPEDGSARYFWPGQELVQSLTDFTDVTVHVPAGDAAA
jgi:predicted choloylglycine hydrolase